MMTQSIQVFSSLLLVAAMSSIAGPDAGLGPPTGMGVTRFVCVNCTATGHPSSRSPRPRHDVAVLSLNMDLFKAKVGSEAGLGGADVAAHSSPMEEEPATSAPDVRHQPPGTAIFIYCNYGHNLNDAASIVIKVS